MKEANHPVVFRELLQNSDDAASKSVEIHFDTQAYLDRKKAGTPEDENWRLPDLKTDPVSDPSLWRVGTKAEIPQVHQWTFKNNGILFRDEDWNRLKKIGVCASSFTSDRLLNFLNSGGKP